MEQAGKILFREDMGELGGREGVNICGAFLDKGKSCRYHDLCNHKNIIDINVK